MHTMYRTGFSKYYGPPLRRGRSLISLQVATFTNYVRMADAALLFLVLRTHTVLPGALSRIYLLLFKETGHYSPFLGVYTYSKLGAEKKLTFSMLRTEKEWVFKNVFRN